MDLTRKFPDLHFFGHGLGNCFRDSGISAVTEMDWWEDAEVVLHEKPDSTSDDGQGPEQMDP